MKDKKKDVASINEWRLKATSDFPCQLIRFPSNPVLGHISAILFHYRRSFSCPGLYIKSISIHTNGCCGVQAAWDVKTSSLAAHDKLPEAGLGSHYHNQWGAQHFLGRSISKPTGERECSLLDIVNTSQLISTRVQSFSSKEFVRGLRSCPEKCNQYHGSK